MKASIQELMDESGVRFGTSGARGLVTEMSDRICYTYTRGFLQYLRSIGELLPTGGQAALGGDLRPSTPRILEAVARGVADSGCDPIRCGLLPSPALALYGFERHIPAIMVTGSHIPDDRNGIKFNKCSGEVLKDDELGITRQVVDFDDALFDATGRLKDGTTTTRPIEAAATHAYLGRYTDAFAPDALKGLRLGVYQHSAVGRDIIVEILRRLGADARPLGRSERFIPVDTEAIREEDVALARQWARELQFDAIVSADGDSDRPLVSDEHGEWLRGDIAGILCARFLEADSISTPVSCNTAVEKCRWFPEVRRTRIGSPFVVAAMQAAAAGGAKRVVGYEANGGFLIQSDLTIEGDRTLRALPTRDAVIVMLGVLLSAKRAGRTVSQLAASLPQRFTASDRLKNFPTEKSRAILQRFSTGDLQEDLRAIEGVFGNPLGKPVAIDRTDGLRVTFDSDEVLHLRPSGNAPEFRCYTEAATDARARTINAQALETLSRLA